MGAETLTGHPSAHPTVLSDPSRRVATAPLVARDGVTFTFADPERLLAGVGLHQELRRPRHGPDFRFDPGSGAWTLFWPRPDVHRMEYRFELRNHDGGTESICDPANPAVAPGPFGDKSVVEWPEYSEPAWCRVERHEGGTTQHVELPSRVLRAAVPALVWTSPGGDEAAPLPLLVAHDGPELAAYSRLLDLLAVMVSQGVLPPLRAALLAPVDRDQHYSASAAYARALALELIPALHALAPVPAGTAMRVGMGASLGALSMLHAQRAYPSLVGALFLQSGSFFRQRFDRQESEFVRFGRITRFVGRILAARDWPHSIPVTMTCGGVEENLANNRMTFDALVAQGYDASLHEIRDAHNWIAWRDAFDPHLVALLARMWT
ncbi:MAG: alpha/beta hydrolase [Actinomycetota bacterium]